MKEPRYEGSVVSRPDNITVRMWLKLDHMSVMFTMKVDQARYLGRSLCAAAGKSVGARK